MAATNEDIKRWKELGKKTRALIDIANMDAKEIVKKSMKIASDLCVYTNNNVIIEEI